MRTGEKSPIKAAKVGNAIFVILFLALAATAAQGAISGSKHDFSHAGYGTDEICIFCHAAHNTIVHNGVWSVKPLWNHTMSTASYTLYSSPTLKETCVQPRGPSKLCLSCHDGTVAIDSFGKKSGSTTATGSANIGTNLADDHPISIKWTHFGSYGLSAAHANCHSGSFPALNGKIPFYGTTGNMYVECGSCHEPHNKFTQYPKMLRKDVKGSAICLACHRK